MKGRDIDNFSCQSLQLKNRSLVRLLCTACFACSALPASLARSAVLAHPLAPELSLSDFHGVANHCVLSREKILLILSACGFA